MDYRGLQGPDKELLLENLQFDAIFAEDPELAADTTTLWRTVWELVTLCNKKLKPGEIRRTGEVFCLSTSHVLKHISLQIQRLATKFYDLYTRRPFGLPGQPGYIKGMYTALPTPYMHAMLHHLAPLFLRSPASLVDMNMQVRFVALFFFFNFFLRAWKPRTKT
jgi:hypothetical protein